MQHRTEVKVRVWAFGCECSSRIKTVTNQFSSFLFYVASLGDLRLLIYVSAKKEKTEWGEAEWVRDRADWSWMNILRIPLNTHAQATLASHLAAHKHVDSTWCAFAFFFLSLSHPSISSNFFFQSHDPSRMLSHTGSSLGSSFSCSLLGCNNYSISQQCVPWLCSWAVSVGGVQWRGETRVWLSLQGKGNMFFFFFLWAGAHPGPTRGEQE